MMCVAIMLAGLNQVAARSQAQTAASACLFGMAAANALIPVIEPHYINGYAAAWSEEVGKRPQVRSVLEMSANVYHGLTASLAQSLAQKNFSALPLTLAIHPPTSPRQLLALSTGEC